MINVDLNFVFLLSLRSETAKVCPSTVANLKERVWMSNMHAQADAEKHLRSAADVARLEETIRFDFRYFAFPSSLL